MLTKQERAFIITFFDQWRENKVSVKSISDDLKVDFKEVEKFLIEVNKIAYK